MFTCGECPFFKVGCVAGPSLKSEGECGCLPMQALKYLAEKVSLAAYKEGFTVGAEAVMQDALDRVRAEQESLEQNEHGRHD